MTDYEDLFKRTMAESPATLSTSGEARRDAMKARLTGAVVSRRRRRTAARWSAATVILAAAAGLIWQLSRGSIGPGTTPGSIDPGREHRAIAEGTGPRDHAPNAPARIVLVRNDDSVLDRYVAKAAPRVVTTVTDAELLSLLAKAERPTGLIRSGKRVIFTREVTDPIVSSK